MKDLEPKIDYLIQLLLTIQAEQKQAQAEFEAKIMAEFSIIKTKLTKIEANTVTVMGRINHQ